MSSQLLEPPNSTTLQSSTDETISHATPLELCKALLLATARLSEILKVQVPSEIDQADLHLMKLKDQLNSLCTARFKDHVPLTEKEIAPLIDSLDTVQWLIERMSHPDFSPTSSSTHPHESSELVIATAGRICRLQTVTKQAELLAEKIKKTIDAKPPEPEIIPEAKRLDIGSYLARTHTHEEVLSDLDPDDDPIGEQPNVDVKTINLEYGGFSADMTSFGGAGFCEEKAGKVTSRSVKALNLLGVTTPAILVGVNGAACDLFAFVEQTKEQFPALQNLIKSASLPAECYQEQDAATYEFPLKNSSGRLPLPPKHQVLAITYLDQSGQPIPSESEHSVTWSVCGGIIATPPDNAVTARYVVAPTSWKVPPETEQQFVSAMTSGGFYAPITTRKAISVAKYLQPKDPEERAQFLYRIVRGQRLIPSHDSNIASVINSSGAARNEVIAGLGCGNCTPLNYYLAAILSKAEIPTVLMMGYPITECGQFLVKPGHTQAFAWGTNRGSTLDITNDLDENSGINCSRLSGAQWDQFITDIRNGTLRDAFLKAREIRRTILCSPEEGAIYAASVSQNSPGFSPLPGSSEVRSIRYNPQTDLSRDKKLDALAAMYQVKIFVDMFRAIAAKGLKNEDLSELYTFSNQGDKLPDLRNIHPDRIPKEFQEYVGFNTERELSDISAAVLNDPNFSSTGKRITSDWMLRNCSRRSLQLSTPEKIFRDGIGGEAGQLNESIVDLRSKAFGTDVSTLLAYSSGNTLTSNIEKALGLVVNFAKIYGPVNFAHPNNPQWAHIENLSDMVPAVETLADGVSAANKIDQQIKEELETTILVAAMGLYCHCMHVHPHEMNQFKIAYYEWGFKQTPMPCTESIERIKKACITILSTLNQSQGMKTLDLAIFTAGYGNKNLQECWSWFRNYCTTQNTALASLFAWETQGEALRGYVTSRLLGNMEQYLGNGYKFEQALPWLASLGVNPNFEHSTSRLKEAIQTAYNADYTPKFNLPLAENPSSRVVHYLLPSSRVQILESVLAISRELHEDPLVFAQEAWPKTDETEVDKYLLSSLKFSNRSHDAMRLFYLGYQEADRNSLSPAEVPNLVRDLAANKAIGAIAAQILERRTDERAQIASCISGLKERYPEMWTAMLEQMARNYNTKKDVMSRDVSKDIQGKLGIALLRPWNSWDIYIAILGINRIFAYNPPNSSSSYNGNDWWWEKNRLASEARKPAITAIEEWEKKLDPTAMGVDLFAPFSLDPVSAQRAKEFSSQLTNEQWATAVLAGIASGESGCFSDFVEAVLGHRSEVSLSEPSGTPNGEHVCGAWKETLIRSVSRGVIYEELVNSIRGLANTKIKQNRLRRVPFSSHLRTGEASIRVSVPSGGEFDQLRQMVPGDDIRMMDWKSYGRTDRYAVRKFIDVEPEAGVFIIDLEWLADKIVLQTNDRSESPPIPITIRALFSELYSSIRSDHYPHLIFCLRGDLVEHYDPKMVKKSLSRTLVEKPKVENSFADERFYAFRHTDQHFIYQLLSKLHTLSEGLKTEYSMRASGYKSTNAAKDITSSLVAQLPKRSKIVAGIHQRNRDATLPYLRSIARHLGSRVNEIDVRAYK